MSDFRARDTDRERAVGVIEAAYADGQLFEADRDLRVGRAHTAETLDELASLTRDLPMVDLPDVPARPVVRRPGLSGRALAAVAIAVVGLLGLGMASTLLATFSGSVDQSSLAPSPAVESVDAQSQGAGFAIAPDRVRTFLRLYERRFETRDSYSVVLTPERAIVEVPVRGPQPRYERWLYDGSWTRLATTSVLLGPAEIVDLGDLDVRQMFVNIAKAERTLGVENGRLSRVVIHRWGEEVASVNIYVGNMFRETGYLAATLPGDRIVRRFPYQP